MTDETVKVRITIEISTDGVLDTGYTVSAWNALTTSQRSKIAQQMWMDEAANADGGGMSVVTEGAEEV